MNNINPLTTMNELKSNGFTEDYVLEEGKICNTSTKKMYTPDEVTIVKEYRFEGYSNPSDMSILYAIKIQNGEKGQIMVSYSPVVDNSDIQAFIMAAEREE